MAACENTKTPKLPVRANDGNGDRSGTVVPPEHTTTRRKESNKLYVNAAAEGSPSQRQETTVLETTQPRKTFTIGAQREAFPGRGVISTVDFHCLQRGESDLCNDVFVRDCESRALLSEVDSDDNRTASCDDQNDLCDALVHTLVSTQSMGCKRFDQWSEK